MGFEAGRVVLKFVADMTDVHQKLDAVDARAGQPRRAAGGTGGPSPGEQTGAIAQGLRRSTGGEAGKVRGMTDQQRERFDQRYENRMAKDYGREFDRVYKQEMDDFNARGSRSYSAKNKGTYRYDFSDSEDSRFHQDLRNRERSRRIKGRNDDWESKVAGIGDAWVKDGDREDDKSFRSFLRDERRDKNSAKRYERAKLSADLSEATSYKQKTAILDKAMAGVAPDSMEYQALRRQRAIVDQDKNVGRMLNRISAFGAAMFAGREIGHVYQAVRQQEKLGLALKYGDTDERLSALAQNADQDIVGYAQTGFKKFLDLFPMQPGKSDGLTSWAKTPAQAVREAQEGENRVKFMNATIAQMREEKSNIALKNAQTSFLKTTDAFQKERDAASLEFDTDQSAITNEREGLLAKIRAASSPTELQNAKSALGFFDRRVEDRQNSIIYRFNTRNEVTDRDEKIAANQMKFENQGADLEMKGDYEGAMKARMSAKYDDRIKQLADGSPIKDQLIQQKVLEERAGRYEINRQRYGEGSEFKSLGLALGRDFLGARIARIHGERDQALEGLDPSSDVYKRRKGIFDRREEIERRDEEDRDKITGMKLRTRQEQITQSLARSKAGSDLAGIVGSSAEEIEQFRQQGKKGFADQAKQAGLDQLQLYKQSYLDNLKGQQVSKFDIDPQNAAGESPVVVLKRIEQAILALGAD